MLMQNYPRARLVLLAETSMQVPSGRERSRGSPGNGSEVAWSNTAADSLPGRPTCLALGGRCALTGCSALPSKTSLNSPRARQKRLVQQRPQLLNGQQLLAALGAVGFSTGNW